MSVTYTELDKAKAVVYGYDDCILVCDNARRHITEQIELAEGTQKIREVEDLVLKAKTIQELRACLVVSAAPFRLHVKLLRDKAILEAPYGKQK